MHRRLIPPLAFALLLAGARTVPAKPAASFDAGFFAARYDDVRGDSRLRVAGPFFESALSTQGWRLVAVRPFYSKTEDPSAAIAREDYLWPLATWRKIREEEQARYLVFFHFKHGEEQAKRRYRFWLLPFYFEGRDAEGVRYRAVFPFGGTIKDFLGRDEIAFVLFPLRSTSKLNDLETSNWLWPLISTTSGEGIRRQRVFPFYGRSIREGAYDKRFILWPIWNDVTYEYEGSRGSGFLLTPIVGRMKLENQETWWVIPPFFRYTKGDRATRLYAPWPFVQRETGPADKFYVWPLWGRKQVGNHERLFCLWPIFWDEKTARGGETRDTFMAVPFYWHMRQGSAGAPPRKRYVKVWPLFSYRREGSESKFRTLELWPLADHSAIERNWAPLWTLYSSVRFEDAIDRELLWGLHRDQKRGDAARRWTLFPLWDWRRGPDGVSWSFLKGLIGRERADSKVEWRVLFFLSFSHEAEAESEP